MAPAASSFVLLAVGASALHCDNGAVAVDACQQIEEKRCEAILGCPNQSIETDDDVQNCKLFYRDQCLFGVADDVRLAPDGPMTEACVAALDQAAACKSAASLAECAAPPQLETIDPSITTGCEVILHPEVMLACSFLGVAPDTSGGGGSGAAVATGGSAGAGGTAGGGG